MEEVFASALFLLPWLYLALQISAIFVMRGWLRTLAKLCAGLMAAAVAVAIFGTVVMGSNIAPIWVVFAAPLLTLILAVLWAIHGVRWLRAR